MKCLASWTLGILSVFHSNVISLDKNLNKVEEIFVDCKNRPSIIAISETGLNGDITSEQVSIDGYHELERDDSHTIKGGVGIYVTEQLDYDTRDDLQLKVENCEDLWLQVETGSCKNMQSFRGSVEFYDSIL